MGGPDDFGEEGNGDQQIGEADDGINSYRLVKKEYFCFVCDKKYKKMI